MHLLKTIDIVINMYYYDHMLNHFVFQQVNAEIKRLLLASVGEDISDRYVLMEILVVLIVKYA